MTHPERERQTEREGGRKEDGGRESKRGELSAQEPNNQATVTRHIAINREKKIWALKMHQTTKFQAQAC